MRFFPRTSRPSTRRRSPRRAQRLRLEALENRCLLSAGWAASTTTTSAHGGEAVGDAVVVGRDVATDNAGNVYITGFFLDTTYFGATPLVSNSGSYDAHVAKLDPSGNFVWAVALGGPDYDVGEAVAVDPVTGDVYVSGTFRGTVDFDPGPGEVTLTSVDVKDAFVLKLDTNANFKWARRAGSAGTRNVVLDGEGHLFVAGSFDGTADFGETTLTSKGLTDGFLAKMTTLEGKFVWARSYGGTGDDIANRPVVDGQGDIYLAGNFSNTVQFGSVPITSAGARDMFVARLTPAGEGEPVWVRRMGGRDDDGWNSMGANGLGIDAVGNVYVGGVFLGTADFGGTQLTSVGIADPFVVKLDPAGAFAWVRQIGGLHDERADDLAVDAAGNTYLTGGLITHNQATEVARRSGAPVDYDPGPGTFFLTRSSHYDAYTLKLDSAGQFASAWSVRGTGALEFGKGIAVDAGGHVYSTGTYGAVAEFNTGTDFAVLSSSQKERETFIAKTTQERGAISGRLFNDLDNDGIHDATEPFLAGQTIYLDSDNDGTLDTGEPAAVSDVDGLFHFWHLQPGTYVVRQALPAGWTQTSGSTAYSMTVEAGRFLGDANFGNFFPNQEFLYTSSDVPKKIPSRNWQQVTSTLTVADSYPIFGLTLSVDVDSARRLDIYLKAPDGTLSGLLRMDGAVASHAEFVLAGFNYKDVRGTWELSVRNGNDGMPGGKLLGWSITVLGARMPQIGSLSASPNPVSLGSDVTLTASDVRDLYPGGTVTSVAFWRDADGDGKLNTNADVLLGDGTQSTSSPGTWSLTSSTNGLAKGSYTYFAQAQDDFGVQSGAASTVVQVGSTTKGKKLLAASLGSGADAILVDARQVRPLLAAAASRWAAAGESAPRLQGVRVRIDDLPGATLARASGNVIWLDADAAGWGWFIDSTPGDDLEFLSPGDQGEQGRIDLLTVLAHELGHLVGRDHEAQGLMADALAPGERRMPAAGQDAAALAALDFYFRNDFGRQDGVPFGKWFLRGSNPRSRR